MRCQGFLKSFLPPFAGGMPSTNANSSVLNNSDKDSLIPVLVPGPSIHVNYQRNCWRPGAPGHMLQFTATYSSVDRR